MSDSINQLHNDIKLQLRMSANEAESLDNAFKAVSRGCHPVVTFAIGIGAVFAFVNGQSAIGVIAALIVFWDVSIKRDFDRNRLRVIANAAAQYVCAGELSRLNRSVSNTPLRSLRESSWHAVFSIIFPTCDGMSFAYHVGPGLIATPKELSSCDLTRLATQLCSGIFVQYHSIQLSLKCDFRVIRTPMTRDEVAGLFRSIGDVLPSMPAKGISIRQYSSTKTFTFGQEYVDAGTISYMHSRTSQRNLQVQKKSERPSGVEQSFPATKPNPSVSERDLLNGIAMIKQSLLLLSDLAEARKNSEVAAMQFVIEYESQQGRTAEDVSKNNCGFDVRSTNSNGEVRRVEVKGLAGCGDVTLTENEVRTACAEPESYYLYIVENCLDPTRARLYILQPISITDLKTCPIGYEVDLTQQTAYAVEAKLRA